MSPSPLCGQMVARGLKPHFSHWFCQLSCSTYPPWSPVVAHGRPCLPRCLQMPPRCLQMPPRCLQMPPDASPDARCLQMPPDARCQMPPQIPDASRCQMPDAPPDARCLPDASRCLPDASQMPPDASQVLPRCLQMPPDASQMPPRCLSQGVRVTNPTVVQLLPYKSLFGFSR